MGKWLEKASDFAMSNVRIIGDAWAAFAVWCFLALLLAWLLMGQIYDVRLTNAQSTISSLNSQLSGVRADVQELRAKLSSKADKQDRWTLAYQPIPDTQFALLADYIKKIPKEGAVVTMGYVDNPSAATLAGRFAAALRDTGIKVFPYLVGEDDPNGHGITLYVRNAERPTDIDQQYIAAFRLSGFTIKVEDIGDQFPPGNPIAMRISYPQ
jgi:type II secretory pathway pseudopilin PulG